MLFRVPSFKGELFSLITIFFARHGCWVIFLAVDVSYCKLHSSRQISKLIGTFSSFTVSNHQTCSEERKREWNKKNTHKSLKIILFIIFSRGTAPLACLNAMLHHHSRGPNDLFIKVEGRMSCYKLNVCKLISVCFN